jgi:hypothetical protein
MKKSIKSESKKNEKVTIKPKISVNRDLSTWDAQFKKAIRKRKQPEKSIWPDNVSEIADKDWTCCHNGHLYQSSRIYGDLLRPSDRTSLSLRLQ